MKKLSDSEAALNAMRRAQIQALEKAAALDQDIPEWQDGKVVYVNAKEKLKRLKSS